MRIRTSKSAEIFAFLAMFFLVVAVLANLQGKKIGEALAEAESLRKEAERARGEAEVARADAERLRRQFQPILMLSEDRQEFRFQVGSPEVPPLFHSALERTIIPELARQVEKCDCDAIEVIGHTDSLHIKGSRSNLDREMAESFSDNRLSRLKPGSNMDLGMLRALAIVKILEDSGAFPEDFNFFPYSAGQMILLDPKLLEDDRSRADPQRRRIEIRTFRRRPVALLNDTQTTPAADRPVAQAPDS